jgi:putative flippase GtrA
MAAIVSRAPRPDPGFTSARFNQPFIRQLASFGAIGIASTAAYVVLYSALRNVAPAAAANTIALVATAVANTAANRRLTFHVAGRDGLARHHAAGLISLAVALAFTSASLGILDVFAPRHGRLTELAALVAANAAATVVRFVMLRVAIHRPAAAVMNGNRR